MTSQVGRSTGTPGALNIAKSDKIEKPSKKIAEVLQALSETSFIVPFTESPPANIAELINILKVKLNQVDAEIHLRQQPADYHHIQFQ